MKRKTDLVKLSQRDEHAEAIARSDITDRDPLAEEECVMSKTPVTVRDKDAPQRPIGEPKSKAAPPWNETGGHDVRADGLRGNLYDRNRAFGEQRVMNNHDLILPEKWNEQFARATQGYWSAKSALDTYERFLRREWIEQFAATLIDKRGASFSRTYAMTFIYDLHRNDVEYMAPPEPAEVRARALVREINNWYVRCFEMFGRDHGEDRASYPRGVGFVHEPVEKVPENDVRRQRHPGEEFQHAHVILRVDDDCPRPPTPGELDSFPDLWGTELDHSNVVRFERLDRSGAFYHEWVDQNPQGKFSIDRLESDDDVRRAFDEAVHPLNYKCGPDPIFLPPFA